MDSAWAVGGDDREWQQGVGAVMDEDAEEKMEELERKLEAGKTL